MDEIRQQVRVRKATLERWLDEDDEFKRAMTIHYNQMLRATRMSRKQVMKGILEAVDLARDQRQANTMITGWKEIGRMCGFYEPERREITLSVNGKQMIEDMKTMTREKLLELASEQDTIEAEFIRIDEDEDDGTT